jgi:predicted dehydrogenase
MTRPTHAARRIGVIGYGLGGAAFHAPFIAATPGLQLSAIVTRDADQQRAAAQKYPGRGRYWHASVKLSTSAVSSPLAFTVT